MIFRPVTAISRASSGITSKPKDLASASTKLSPPKAVQLDWAQTFHFNSGAETVSKGRKVAQRNPVRLAIAALGGGFDEAGRRLERQLRTGSSIGMMPVSRRTVATQMELEPGHGGVSSGP